MMQPTYKQCPKCNLQCFPGAQRCLCGHSFSSSVTQQSPPQPQSLQPTQPQPAQIVQPQPVIYQTPIQRPSGFIQFAPGAISPLAGFLIALFLPMFGCAYNRQWTKQLVFLAFFFAFGVNAASSNPTYGNWGMMLFWALSVVDTTLNSAALASGYAITHTTFFGVPYTKDPNCRAFFEQTFGWMKNALIAVIAISSLMILLMLTMPIIEKRQQEAKFKAIDEMGHASYYKSQIRGGESTEQIFNLIGRPNSGDENTQNGAWIYWMKGESLRIDFQDGKVISASIENYSPIR